MELKPVIDSPKEQINQLSGKRLKEEAHSRNWSNRKVADVTGYSTPSGDRIISMIYGGKRKMSDFGFKKLAEAWNIREEYLRGLDSFKTEQDIYNTVSAKESEKFQIQVAYLKTIGITIKPKLSVLLSSGQLRKNWDAIKSCLTLDSLNHIIEKYDMSLPYPDFLKKYGFDNYETVDLQKTFENVTLDKIVRNKGIKDIVKSAKSFTGELKKMPVDNSNFDYSLTFDVVRAKNGILKWKKTISASNLDFILEIFDKYSENSLDLIFDVANKLNSF